MDMSESLVVAISAIVGFVFGCATGWKLRKPLPAAKNLEEDPTVIVAEDPLTRS